MYVHELRPPRDVHATIASLKLSSRDIGNVYTAKGAEMYTLAIISDIDVCAGPACIDYATAIVIHSGHILRIQYMYILSL